MSDQIDLSFQVLDTTIHVAYADIMSTGAETLVSSDDAYLSMKCGVSLAILDGAGPDLRDEVHKHTLPFSLGDVVVTGSGRLRCKYVFHAITLDFFNRQDALELLHALVFRIISLAQVLNVTHIALPLLGAGSTKLPREQVVDAMVRAAVCTLCQNGSKSIRNLTFAISSSTIEPDQRQAQLHSELAPALGRLNELAMRIAPLNERIHTLAPLAANISDDQELREILLGRVEAARTAIAQLCDCVQFATVQHMPLQIVDEEERAYLERKSRLVLERLQEDIEQFERLQRANERRLNLLQVQRASMGITTPPHVAIEITDLEDELDRLARDRAKAEDELVAAQRTLMIQRRSWSTTT